MKCKWQIALAALAGGAALWTAGCESDSLYEGVAIVPASVELRVGQSQTFRASGGQNYEWSFEPVDGRLGLNTTVGDTVVVTALSSEAGGETSAAEETEDGTATAETGDSVVALTCRSIIPGVTYVETNGAGPVATAFISIR